MSIRIRSQFSLVASLALGGLGCPAPSTGGDGSTAASTTEASSTTASASTSTSEGPEPDSGSSGLDDTTAGPDLGPPAQCVNISRLSFEDLIDGVASGEVLVDARPLEVTDVEVGDVDGTFSVVGVVGDDLLVLPLNEAAEAPAGPVYWIQDDVVFEGEVNAVSFDEDQGTITIDPLLVHDPSGDETLTVSTCLALGAGASRFEIDGTTATVEGTLGSVTFAQVEAIIAQRPDVDTLVMQHVPGSINDDVNVETGRMIRAAGWNTFVPADGEIASGGVDLFCAGVGRAIEPGAQLGVHSWSDGTMDGADYPPDDPAHASQLAYFTEMLGDPLGPDFYWFTLSAAPADDIHWMTEEEIATYQLLAP